MRKIRQGMWMTVFFLLAALLVSPSAEAKEIKMLFWYPGETGSTAQAQPLLNAFCEYLSPKIAPDKMTGRYFNNLKEGLLFIKREQPTIGIVSYATWAQNQSHMARAELFMATLPLASGKATEQYTLAGREAVMKSLAPQILASEPLSGPFVNAELFTIIPATSTIVQTPQLLAKLRDIGEGRTNAVAILTPTEAATLAKLSAPWAKAIKVLAQSKPVPTARVLLFDQSWSGAPKMKAALSAAGSDPKARDILAEMRLKGFTTE